MHRICNDPAITHIKLEQNLFLRISLPCCLAALLTSFLSTLLAGLEATAEAIAILKCDVML